MSSIVMRVLDDSFFRTASGLAGAGPGCTFHNANSLDKYVFSAFNGTLILYTARQANQSSKATLTLYTNTLSEDWPGTFIEFYGITPPPQFDGPFLFFDYAVMSVGELEDLDDQTIIVDDSNTEIQWGGNWEEKRNYTVTGPGQFTTIMSGSGAEVGPLHARPHGNGTHESDNVGDYFIFQFQGDSKIEHCVTLVELNIFTLGSSILVAGITPLNRTYQMSTASNDPFQDGPVGNFHLKLNFTLDGHSQAVVFTSDRLSQLGGTPHFPYFQNNSLVEGNHTLIMTVDDVTGDTAVVIDYLTYKPSFATLKDKPTFPPIIFNDNSTSAPNSSQSPDPPPGSRSNKGIIAGSVVGGVASISLLALGVWLLYKKKQVRHWQLDQRGSMNAPSITQAMSNLIVEPFLFQNPTHPLPRKDTSSIPQVQPPSLAVSWEPSPLQHAELRRQREELEETMQNFESQSVDRNSDQNLVTQDQMREMLTRIDVLTREMGRYVEPPGYDSR
ncbi:hypothetical protein K435DRAFT_807556 [Dendrothele bispora CBS 962.96]|uniref:Uncharacterized protein n=1 Tax=Dendrothele bispora (strain CBS 962.96) TaxID=1314807 RepID=A0A4S8L4A7_DENBC|nr:hypothetical protein K435DRAFT_807556 [Dendrothele bispora CBS 962.96]